MFYDTKDKSQFHTKINQHNNRTKTTNHLSIKLYEQKKNLYTTHILIFIEFYMIFQTYILQKIYRSTKKQKTHVCSTRFQEICFYHLENVNVFIYL